MITRIQMSLGSLLCAIACVAINIWLFRQGPLWGIVGIHVSRHVLIAIVCKEVGLDRRGGSRGPGAPEDVSR